MKGNIVSLSNQDLENIYLLIGYAALTKGKVFEKHFTENRKFLTLYRDVVLKMWGISYHDSLLPEPDIPEAEMHRRRVKFEHAELSYFPLDQPITEKHLKNFIEQYPAGLPVAIITETDMRKNELYSLGDFRNYDFCDVMDYTDRHYRGEVRLYRTPVIMDAQSAKMN
jgi:hypothetical protein